MSVAIVQSAYPREFAWGGGSTTAMDNCGSDPDDAGAVTGITSIVHMQSATPALVERACHKMLLTYKYSIYALGSFLLILVLAPLRASYILGRFVRGVIDVPYRSRTIKRAHISSLLRCDGKKIRGRV